MKNLLILVVLTFSFSVSALGNNIADGKVKIVENAKVEFTVSEGFDLDFILSSGYNDESEKLEFLFDATINMIQVYNDLGELEMVLPISSKKLSLGMSLFDQGNYKIGFVLDNTDEVKYTELLVR